MVLPQAAGGGNEFDIWREKTIGCLRKLHNDEPHNLYSLVNIVIIMMLTRMRWALYASHV
jgi:hypothetical protein